MYRTLGRSLGFAFWRHPCPLNVPFHIYSRNYAQKKSKGGPKKQPINQSKKLDTSLTGKTFHHDHQKMWPS